MTRTRLALGVYEVIGISSSYNFSSQCQEHVKHPRDYEPIYEVYIRPGITRIPYRGFFQCRKLGKVILPNTLEYISEEAFFETYNLSTLVFPDTLKDIELNAFTGSGITNITIPNAMITIPHQIFQGMPKLTYVYNFHNVKYIGNYSFSGCNIEYIDDYSNVRYFGKGCFSGCNFKNFSFPEATEYIGEGVLQNNEYLVNCYIPEKFNYIPDRLFYGCYNFFLENFEHYISFGSLSLSQTLLKNLTIRVGYSYGDNAFSRC